MFKPNLRGLMLGAAALAVSALLAVPAYAQKTKITVYSALESDQIGPYKAAFADIPRAHRSRCIHQFVF